VTGYVMTAAEGSCETSRRAYVPGGKNNVDENLPCDFVCDRSMFNGDWEIATVVEATKVWRNNFVARPVSARQRRTTELQASNSIRHYIQGGPKTHTQFYFWDNFGNSAPILTIISQQAEIYGA